MNRARLLGDYGESLAAEYLRSKKMKVISMGYTTRSGEIDIIAEDRRYVVFVEVKTRKNARFAEAREFVTAEKQRKILDTARLWLAETGCEKQPRFDVIEVYLKDGLGTRMPDIRHIENAFGE